MVQGVMMDKPVISSPPKRVPLLSQFVSQRAPVEKGTFASVTPIAVVDFTAIWVWMAGSAARSVVGIATPCARWVRLVR
jgi:hypothetical protein